MYRLKLLLVFLLCHQLVISQDKKDISWIENNLRDHVIIEGQDKSYTIDERMKEYNVPGASIAIIRNGEIVFAKGYGIANQMTGTTVNAHTLFQAGSISKPIAALAVIKLVEEGKLDLDEDVNLYLKSWKIPENEFTETEKVTLRRLLTHTAGINVHGFPGYPLGDKVPSTEDVLNGKGNTNQIKVVNTPGESWQYSGGGYTIIQQVISDVSGMELSDYMEKNILPEIGMTESTFKYALNDSMKSIVSAAYDKKGKIYKEQWRNYPETAAAGLWTTPSDLAQYCFYIQRINTGTIDGIFSKEMIDQVLSPGKNNWGLGVSLQGEGDSLRFGHGGKNAGFTNDLMAFAFKEDAVIIMTNGDNGNVLISDITRAVSTYYEWNLNNYIYAKPIELSKKELKKYTGHYELKMGNRTAQIVAKIKRRQIVLSSKQLPGDLRLTPISENRFVDLNRGQRIEFNSNESQKITHFIVNEQMKAIKI